MVSDIVIRDRSMYSRESIKAFVEEYVYTIKEFIDTSVDQLSIPHHFVNSSFPRYMTAKGIYAEIYASKEGLAIAFDLKDRSKLESHVEYASSPVTELFSKKTENVIPFFQVDEPFCTRAKYSLPQLMHLSNFSRSLASSHNL